MAPQPMAPQPALRQGVALLPMPLQITPPSLLHGKMGMLIGFLAGMLVMAAFVALYVFLSR
jgi:hypothetical protein